MAIGYSVAVAEVIPDHWLVMSPGTHICIVLGSPGLNSALVRIFLSAEISLPGEGRTDFHGLHFNWISQYKCLWPINFAHQKGYIEGNKRSLSTQVTFHFESFLRKVEI